jgi:chitosanase
MPNPFIYTLFAGLFLTQTVFGQTVSGPSYNKPSAGPPASFFSAASTIDVQAIKTAVAQATGVPKSAVYDVNGAATKVTIHNDYMSLPTVRSFNLDIEKETPNVNLHPGCRHCFCV